MLPRALIEFPADDPERARRFWSGVLGVPLVERAEAQGAGWETGGSEPGEVAFGVHARGAGPGDTGSLPYFTVPAMDVELSTVTRLGGTVVHPGEQWSICRDCEGSPFALATPPPPEG